MFSKDSVFSVISVIPFILTVLVLLSAWGSLLFIPYYYSVPLACVGVFSFYPQFYFLRSSLNFRYYITNALKKRYSESGLLSEYPNITEWKKGDKVKITFLVNIKNRQGEKVYWKRTPDFQRFENSKFTFKGISDSDHLILEDVSGDLHEINVNEFIGIENIKYQERLANQKQNRLERKVNEGTVYEEALEELNNMNEQELKTLSE